jgi:colanic acid biosynthesis glycosyl transferase WcaI
MTTRDEVVILYPFADDTWDATAEVVRSLGQMLVADGFRVTSRTMRRGAPPGKSRIARGLARARGTVRNWRYLVAASAYITLNYRTVVAVISVDVPIGVRQTGRTARLLSRGDIQLVSWVMDLYWSPKKLARQMAADERRREISRSRRSTRGLGVADVIVVIGRCMVDVVQDMSGRSSSVIPLWKSPTPSTVDMRERLSITPEQFVVLYAGNAGDNHPLGGLVSAVDQLACGDDLVVLIVGRGTEIDRLKSGPQAFPGIRFIDPVAHSDLSALLASADLHVASLSELATGTCVPSKAYTAFAAGKPCLFLGSPETQVALDIKAADIGAVAATDDAREIARRIQFYVDDRGLAVRQGRAALEFMETYRSPAMAAAQWSDLIRRAQSQS